VTYNTRAASVCAAMTEQRGSAQDRSPGGKAGDAQGMNLGMQVLSYLISGVLLYGALGWVGDHFLGTKFLLPVGIILGAGLAVYMIIKRVGLLTDGTHASPGVAAGRPEDGTEGKQ
jgi:F0F1-type ATP synthase assembly protein I